MRGCGRGGERCKVVQKGAGGVRYGCWRGAGGVLEGVQISAKRYKWGAGGLQEGCGKGAGGVREESRTLHPKINT